MNLNYTYKIKSIDIEAGTFIVEYIPENTLCSNFSVNTYLYFKPLYTILDENGEQMYSSIEEVPFETHFNFTIENSAPLDLWKRQILMQQNISVLTTAMN